ncbi:MAG: CHASE3 domain-containing protein [Candidatus Obscuribacterales bacterium]|nr:CHASE3 domain-containing protein [Candidatus Obscuribacterales bacterium]
MRLNLKLSHKGLILVAVPVISQLLFLSILFLFLRNAEHEILKERHSRTVIMESNLLLKDFVDAGFAMYMWGTTGADPFLERYKELSDEIPNRITSLKISLRDSPNQKEALERLEKVGNRASKLLGQGSKMILDSSSLKRLGSEREAMEKVLADLSGELRSFVREQEKAESIDTYKEARSRELVLEWIAGGVAFNIAVAVALAMIFNRGTTRRLAVLMDNTERLSRSQKLHQRIGGGDEIARLDTVFHNMADALAEAARRKQELVSMVSHDLRTPLTSVQASLTLLSEGVMGTLPVKAQKEVLNAETNTGRLINLINDLLDIEKMEAGQMRVERCLTDVQSIFERSAEAVKGFADKQKVTVKIETTDLDIYADGDRMIQVVINLLSNAIKFSPEGSTVTLNAIPSPEDMVELRVIDQGRGIPEEFKACVFERFQQVELSDAKTKKGTGLGLAICKALVEIHDGSIGVESEQGKGSTFWFRIPASQRLSMIAPNCPG